jgi:TetR/AcrR family transcriptional regulator, transcriptional repressor for nem operon
MRYSAEHKQQTRTRILQAAGALFRKEGYGGSGIDGLTKAAGVTNGAFYGHFRSKSEAFRTTVLDGLEQLRLGIADLKAGRGRRWFKTFVDIYLGEKRTCDIGEGCALPSLSPEVMRADAQTRRSYEAELRRIIDEVATGLSDRAGSKRDDAAIALLALLAGGVTLARAVADPALSERIALAVKRHALAISQSVTRED